MVRSPVQKATQSIACVNSFYWYIFKDMKITFNENNYDWTFCEFVEYGAGFEMIGARVANGDYQNFTYLAMDNPIDILSLADATQPKFVVQMQNYTQSSNISYFLACDTQLERDAVPREVIYYS